ncbi:hypothetical protein V5799_011752 [Amblyomma americanum]|uniref:Secreted protein n=1 Tax=Amblyomma americanum TaxID=6943 RepID=A0AAQ4EG91_AMBAM
MAAICAYFLLRVVVVNIAVAEGSWKISQGSGVHYKEGIMGKILASLFARRVPFLPDHYFAVRNPFNESDTLFRFNLSDGRLFLRGTLPHRENTNVCRFTRSRSPGGFCRLPIVGSFATYNCTLSYGRYVTDTFSNQSRHGRICSRVEYPC